MSEIPKKWNCTKVLIAGPMPTVRVALTTPVDVVFARVVNAVLPTDVRILGIDNLNKDEVLFLDASGTKMSNYQYNYFHSGVSSNAALVFPNESDVRSQRMSTITVRALNIEGIPSEVEGSIYVEVELWSYSA